MPILEGIIVRLLDGSDQRIRSFPDPEPQTTPRTISHLIEYKPGEAFQVHMTANSSYRTGLPEECKTIKTRVHVEGTLVHETGIRHRDYGAAPGQGPNYKLNENLFFPFATNLHTTSTLIRTPAGPNEVQVELMPYSGGFPFGEPRVQLADATLTWKFKYRTQDQLQPLLDEDDFGLLINAHLPAHPAKENFKFGGKSQAVDGVDEEEPAAAPSNNKNQSKSKSAGDVLTSSHPNINIPSQMYCCRRILRGAQADPNSGVIPHTGVIVCDNEWCQAPDNTWHKFCAGMEVDEEPLELWLCPECRKAPKEQLEIDKSKKWSPWDKKALQGGV